MRKSPSPPLGRHPVPTKCALLATALLAACTDEDVTPQPDEIALPGDAYHPESLFADADGTLYVGSLVTGQVVAFAEGETKGTVVVGASSGVTGVAGVTVRGDELWLCSIDTTFQRPTEVRSFTIDGAARATHTLGSNRFCNDLAFDAAGALYVTDSFSGTVLRLAPGGAALEPWLEDAALVSVSAFLMVMAARKTMVSASRSLHAVGHGGKREAGKPATRGGSQRRT